MEARSWWLPTQTCEEEHMEQRKGRRNEGTGEMGQKKKVVPVLVTDCDRSVTALQEIVTDCDRSVTISDTTFFLTDFRSK